MMFHSCQFSPSSTAALKKALLSRHLVNSSDILGGSHCLAPACLRASLASSLAKLRIQTLDLLYLHNPAEVQLEARGKAGFFEVLRAAFKVCVGVLRHSG
jgi:aryl-alcohol dehydrogenase-like predicted oxidoreductase